MLSPERESHRAESQESECPRGRGSCHSRACVLPSWLSPFLSDEISVAGSLHPAERQLRRAEQFEPRPNPVPGPVRFVHGVRSGQRDSSSASLWLSQVLTTSPVVGFTLL